MVILNNKIKMDKLKDILIGSIVRHGNETVIADARIVTLINSGAKHHYKPVIVCDTIADWICHDNGFVSNNDNTMYYEFEGETHETPCLYTVRLHEWQMMYRLLTGQDLIVRTSCIDELLAEKEQQAELQAYDSYIESIVDEKIERRLND